MRAEEFNISDEAFHAFDIDQVDSILYKRFSMKDTNQQEMGKEEHLDEMMSNEFSECPMSGEIEIRPNIEGLVNYFTAKNIRHKIRHPIFLALKFHQCIEIMFNPALVTSQS